MKSINDIASRLDGKNPNRVVPQLKRQLKIQKLRFGIPALIAVIAGVFLARSLLTDSHSWESSAYLLLATVFFGMSAVFDWILYLKRRSELKLIEDYLDNRQQKSS